MTRESDVYREIYAWVDLNGETLEKIASSAHLAHKVAQNVPFLLELLRISTKVSATPKDKRTSEGFLNIFNACEENIKQSAHVALRPNKSPVRVTVRLDAVSTFHAHSGRLMLDRCAHQGHMREAASTWA